MNAGGEILFKLLAKSISGSQTAGNLFATAVCTVAEVLLSAISVTLAQEIGDLKATFIEREKIKTDSQRADAAKKIAAAAQASNQVTRRVHQDALAREEIKAAQLANAKKAAEAAKAEADALKAGQTVEKAQIDNAKAKLLWKSMQALLQEEKEKDIKRANQKVLDALRQLQLQDGSLSIDPAQLSALIKDLQGAGTRKKVGK